MSDSIVINQAAPDQITVIENGGTQGPAGPSGGAVLTVADLAAMSAHPLLGLEDGELVYVQSIKSYFFLDLTSGLTADGISIVVTSGAGRWIRIQSMVHPFWKSQDVWQIDPVAGDDENDGLTSGTALKTWGELSRRLYQQVVENPTFFCVITVLGDLPASDPINLECTVGTDMLFSVFGSPTVARSSTLTAVTALDRPTNQPWEISDSSLTPGAWTAEIGKPLKISSGANAGNIFWIAKDLGGTTARISAPAQLFPGQGFGGVTPGILAVTDPYDVLTLTKAFMGLIDVRIQTVNSIFGASIIEFNGFDFQDAFQDDPLITQSTLICSMCSFGTFTVNQPTAIVFLANMCARNGLQMLAGATEMDAGLILSVDFPAQVGPFGGSSCRLDADVLLQGTSLSVVRGGNANIGFAGVFDSVVNSILVPGGDGIALNTDNSFIGNPNASISINDGGYGGSALYGSGAAGKGLYVGAGGTVLCKNVPTVTGVGGDFGLSSPTAARAFDETTDAYSTTRAETWVNFVATILGGGFANAAHNVNKNSHLIKV